MNKLTALIVDDEEDGRDTLRNFLQRYCPEVTSVAEASSVQEAITRIGEHQPTLVFLDINMPHENGFELFRSIPEPHFHTVFVTAHDEYALQAIKHHALDYILKPINIEELIAAVDRAKMLAGKQQTAIDFGSLSHLMQAPSSRERLALPILDGFIYVLLNDVVRCEAEGNYSTFYFTNGRKLLVCRTLGFYEEMLKETGFMRVHHHHLINVAHVDKYQRGRGGIITMSDGTEVAVSQRKKDDFLRMIGGS
jgi:two-component system LytT family response regulator